VRKIGRYQLVARMASGTLGDVYFAQGETTSERFAIKLIKPELAGDPRIARLVQIEGQTAANFSHPVAVRVHEAEREGPELFVAMELIGGQAFSSVLKKLRVDGAPLDHRLVCHVGAEIASVLAKAHELPWFTGATAKFVHGCLAPKRIMLGYDGETKLLGLGSGRARLTQPLGQATLPYASPEVAAEREPTPRSDVYSLAALLYHAFSGRSLARQGARSASVPPLNSTTLTIDPSIGDLIAEMMAPRAEARPESMAVLEMKLRAAARVSKQDAALELARLMQREFAEDADAFRRQTKAVKRAASVPPREEKKPRLPREDSRLAEVPKVGWGTGSDTDSVDVVESTVTEPDRPPPQLGRIARYVIERPLDKSGIFAVYACRDPNLARPLVLKVLDPEAITDPRLTRTEWVRLFKTEARIAGRLHHESFPTLYDAGRDEGSYFIAFEAIPGDTLQQRHDKGERFNSHQVRRIATDLARGLFELHRMGVVHGDIKASNVMLGDDGHAKIIDFSLASYVDGPQHPLLASNVMVAAPEVIAGGPYTPQTEQFALGALIYELLVGMRPFRGVDDRELAAAIKSSVPRPPEAIDSTVDPVLSEVCMRLLEKDPLARFESLGKLVDRLVETSREPSTVLDYDTEPMMRASLPGFDAGSLADALIRLCERVSTLSAPDFVPKSISDAPSIARSVARKLGLGEESELKAALAVAIRDLAERARMSVQSEEMAPLVPRQVMELVLAADRVGDEGEGDALPQVVAVVEAYFRATRPRDGTTRSSPRRAVLDLKAKVGRLYQNEVLEALVEHLREVVSALDLTPAAAEAKRILVAGYPSDALMHALEFDGFAIEEATDGHDAWEKLRKDAFFCAIVDASLPGRDALSLLKLCRSHPDTEKIAFLILGNEGMASEVADAGSAAVLERTAALDSIRAEVGRLIGK
jgi:serine/threonine protein kinase/CheY-like chemotaxis protein